VNCIKGFNIWIQLIATADVNVCMSIHSKPSELKDAKKLNSETAWHHFFYYIQNKHYWPFDHWVICAKLGQSEQTKKKDFRTCLAFIINKRHFEPWVCWIHLKKEVIRLHLFCKIGQQIKEWSSLNCLQDDQESFPAI